MPLPVARANARSGAESCRDAAGARLCPAPRRM